MPRAKPEATEGMGERALKLKKAGLPVIAVILLAIVGAPGFWEHFFNTTDDEAKAKAEVSYQLLKAHTEALTEQMIQYRHEMNDLRDVINSMLLQRSAAGMAKMPEVIPAPRLAPLPDSLDVADDTASGRAAMASVGVDAEAMGI